MTQQRWLVTGATGLLGVNACLVLQQSGTAHVTALTRQNTSIAHANATVHADLLDATTTKEEILQARPQVILHAAALASHEECEGDPDLAHRMNVDATANVIEAAREIGALVIHVSTDAVFDGTTGNYREDSPVNPFSVYGKTKLLAEEKALTYENSIVVRTNFFGWSASGTRSILEFFVNNLEADSSVKGFTDFTVTSIYAPHLISVFEELSRTDYRGILNIAARNSLTKYEFGRAVALEFNLDGTLIEPTTSTAVGLHTSRARDLSLDVSRAERLLNRTMPTQEAGMVAARIDRKTR